jgi:hypothetical protein
MSLSLRATKYLESLQRLEPVPTKQVEVIFQAQGLVAHKAWLDFHEKYAGYVEPLGLDMAVWGLAHHRSHWFKPLTIYVEQSLQAEADWFVACAEVHPSYVYKLGDTGFFRDPAANSFDVKVERNAARVEFFAAGRTARVFEVGAPQFIERAQRAEVIHEASDTSFRVFATAGIFAVQNARSGQFVEGWVREG